MQVETLDDLALVTGDKCCLIEIEAHSAPTVEGEIISESMATCYYSQHTANGGTGKFRRRVSTVTGTRRNSAGDIVESGTTTETWDKRRIGEACDLNYSVVPGYPDSPSLTGTTQVTTITEVGVPPADYTRTANFKFYRFYGTASQYLYWEQESVEAYSEAYQDIPAELLDELSPVIDALVFPDDATPGTPIASNSIPSETLTLQKARYRWLVPVDYPFNYLKITWDVLDEPDGWDDPVPTVNRSFLYQDLTWEWTGGDTESPWYEIPYPEIEGDRRIVNVRYEVFRSTRFGVLPFAIGEAVGDDEL